LWARDHARALVRATLCSPRIIDRANDAGPATARPRYLMADAAQPSRLVAAPTRARLHGDLFSAVVSTVICGRACGSLRADLRPAMAHRERRLRRQSGTQTHASVERITLLRPLEALSY